MRNPPYDLITPQRLHLLTPLPGGVAFQYMNFRRDTSIQTTADNNLLHFQIIWVWVLGELLQCPTLSENQERNTQYSWAQSYYDTPAWIWWCRNTKWAERLRAQGRRGAQYSSAHLSGNSSHHVTSPKHFCLFVNYWGEYIHQKLGPECI